MLRPPLEPRSSAGTVMLTRCFWSEEAEAARAAGHPVVALESALLTHGLPEPLNLETALAAEAAIREGGCVPATIAILDGEIHIGLTRTELERLASERKVIKASRRDLAPALVAKKSAATTVAATSHLAHLAGIRFFATGGIGGVHLDFAEHADLSADLVELARIPITVVSAGAKCILDLPKTVELLEAASIPVVGYRTLEFPAFYSAVSGLSLSWSCSEPSELAALAREHWRLGNHGLLVVQPPPAASAVPPVELARWLDQAKNTAKAAGVTGAAVTPLLLQELARLSDGRTLRVNRDLVVTNARLASEIATAYWAAEFEG